MAYTTGKSLPENYFELDYIESTGTQWIDTGVSPTANTIVDITFTPTGGLSENSIFGSRWAVDGFFLMFYQSKIRWHSGGTVIDIGTYKAGDRVSCTCANNYIIVNGTKYDNVAASGNTTNSIQLLGAMDNGNNYTGVGKLEHVRIKDGDTIIREYVPAMSPSGVIGLYDLATDVFYANSGSGTFRTNIAPNSQLPSGITELAYIRSFGDQWIDTGYVYKQIPTAEIDYATETHKNSEIFGWGAKELYSMLINDDVGDYDNRLDLWNGVSWDTVAANGTIPNCVRSRNKLMIAKNGSSFDVLQNGIKVGTVANANDFSPNNYTARVFSARTNANHIGRLYGAKLWDNENLVRDLVPCRLANGTVGVYDLVQFKFYGNAGSGSFGAGPSLSDLPTTYSRLEYIQSTGTQYLNTDITGNASDKFELRMDVAYTDISRGEQIHQIMGFNGHSGCGIGPAGQNWWEASTFSQVKQSQHVHAEWYMHGSSWYRSANGLSLSGTNASSSNTTNATLNLFGTHESVHNTNINYWCYCKMYSAEVLVNNVVVRNFIPCSNAEGIIGMFDSIEGHFYTDSGLTGFTGPTSNTLPTDFIPVEYIESFGEQWINSGVKVKGNTWFETDLTFSSAFNYNFMVGCWSNLALALRAERELCIGVAGTEKQPLSDLNTVSGVKYNYIMGPNCGIIQNGVQYSIGGSSNNASNGEIFVFAATNNVPGSPYRWADYGKGKLYYLKIYEGVTGDPENSKCVRSFVPCLNSSGEPGLYDTVGKRFYHNQGTGTFTAGPIVGRLPVGFTRLNVIESSGTQAINTGYYPASEDLKYVLDFAEDPVVAGTSLFGAEYNGSTRQWAITGYQGNSNGVVSYYVGTSGGVLDQNINKGIRQILTVKATRGTFTTTLGQATQSITYSGSLLKSCPITVFSNNDGASYYQLSSIKLYGFQISDSGILVRAFVPCLTTAGEAGLYDYITGKFYGNAGSGTLVPRSPAGNLVKHKTLINGTSYDIVAGKAMVDGTVREIINGRTLVNGTGYSIPLKNNVIEITLDPNGGSGGTSKFYYHYGKNMFFAEPECWNQITSIELPTRSGYTFVGYNGDGTNGGSTSETYVFSDKSISTALCTQVYKSATLKAQWGEKTYTLYFDANGGSTPTASKAVVYTKALGTLPTPTRAGYWFVGWYSINYKDQPWVYYGEANGDVKAYYNGDPLAMAGHYWDAGRNEGRRICEYVATDNYNTVGDMTIYAGWTPIYTINQSTQNWSDWSGLKDLAWEDYEGYRAMSINWGGDIAATTRSDTAIYGQALYFMATNKYSERWSNIFVNGTDQGEYLKAEYTMRACANMEVIWVFDTRNWIFSNPQAFWDCYLWY